MWEDDVIEEIDINKLSMGELQDYIGELFQATPTDKRKINYKQHIKKYNEVCEFYNKKAKMKIYVIVK